jgi:DNA-binding NarL/FixJ family response regulator
MSKALTLLMVDDHPIFRLAVRHALDELLVDGRMIEAASQNALEAALAETPEVDLVLLDLAIPGAMGFSSLVLLRSERPDLPVIVVSSNDHPRTIRRALQFGAAGFVPKSATAEHLAEAVRAVLAGRQSFPASKAGYDQQDAQLAGRLATLTPQQLRVLMGLAEGLLNKQIAAELKLSENTVKIHVTAVLAKLDCRSRTQAALLAKSLDMDEGLH